MKRTAHAKEVILELVPLLGRSPLEFMQEYVYGQMRKTPYETDEPELLFRKDALAVAGNIHEDTSWEDLEALMSKYEGPVETNAHLQAIDPTRYHETELLHIGTFTLPECIQCKRCSYKLALVTDQVNAVPDSEASLVFQRQITLLRDFLTADHENGHSHWRFISDGDVVTRVGDSVPEREKTVVN